MEDIRKALGDGEDFWLNLSILLYLAVLPFNAFALHILPGPYFRLNVTKAALLLVVIFGLRSYLQGGLEIKKAYLLYLFLILQIFANFLSVLNSAHPGESVLLAITVSQYSFVVFILVNAIRSEVLLGAALRVMGFVVLIIVMHSLGIYVWNGGEFATLRQPSLLGNDIGHYLAYSLSMFGTGLVYSLFQESKGMEGLFWVLTGLWIFIIQINATKVSSIVLFCLVFLLLLMLPQQRKKVIALIVLTVLVFSLVFFQAPITDAFWSTASCVLAQVMGLTLDARDESPDSSLYYRIVVGGNSLQVRVRGWLSGVMIGASHPWFGVGVGQTRYYIEEYSESVRQMTQNVIPDLPLREYILTDTIFRPGTISVYNIFLNAWAETGILGLVALLGILFAVAYRSIPVLLSLGQSMKPVHFLMALFPAILLYHQVAYLWLHPWLWTIIAFTYASLELSDTPQQNNIHS